MSGRPIEIGSWAFDHSSYDVDADVAYLSIGEPRPAVGEMTPEGHIALFDAETHELCGVTLVGVSRILSGELDPNVTIPVRETIESSSLDDLVPA